MRADRKSRTGDWVVCPFCGEEIPASSPACPECGSDENTGWSEERYLDGIELLSDDDEQYERALQEEFGSNSSQRSRFRWWHILAAALLLVLSAYGLIRLIF